MAFSGLPINFTQWLCKKKTSVSVLSILSAPHLSAPEKQDLEEGPAQEERVISAHWRTEGGSQGRRYSGSRIWFGPGRIGRISEGRNGNEGGYWF